MFQTFNMPQHPNHEDAFCFDCIYRHEYRINQCSHTICLTCMYEAVDEKIRRQSKIFICPRCTDSEERRSRLGQSMIQRPNVVRSPKVDEKTVCNQQSEPTVVSDEEHGGLDLSWRVGTESWHIHEIKSQRTLGVVQEEQRVSHQECTIANLFQYVSDTEDGAAPDSFWPVGNESWFVHEIKPQREPRACKSCVGKLMIGQSTTNNDKLHGLEDLPGSATNGGCAYTEPEAAMLDDQSQFGIIQRLNQLESAKKMAYVSHETSQYLNATTSIDNQSSVFKQKLKITSVRCTVKLHNSLLPVGSTVGTTRQDCSNNRLLRRLGKAVALLFFFLFSMINRIEVLPVVSHFKTKDHVQRSTVESKLIVNTIPPTTSKRHLERFISYAKTIEILRNLESLLIYAIT